MKNTLLYILLCETVGWAVHLATRKPAEDWYSQLRRPWFTPPNRVFAPVWVTLYLLMGIAAARVVHDPWCALLFWLQLSLNALWPFLFFRRRRLGWAFVTLVCLWSSIALCVQAFGSVDPWAARLFWPYWAWVSFAAILNFEIWRMNAVHAQN